MPDEYKELNELPQEEGVQTPPPKAEATEIPDNLTAEDLKKYTPEQLTDFYNNVREMRKSSTQKFQEASELRRTLETEREALQRQQYEMQQQQEKFYTDLQKMYQTPPPPRQQPQYQQQETPPAFDAYNPERSYQQLWSYNQNLKKEIEDIKQGYNDRYSQLENEIKTTQHAVGFREFFKENVASECPDVSKEQLDGWFTQRPWEKADNVTIMKAARELQGNWNNRIENEVKRRIDLRQKEELARQATIESEGNVGAIEPIKDYIDLPEEEQEAIFKKDIEKFRKMQEG